MRPNDKALRVQARYSTGTPKSNKEVTTLKFSQVEKGRPESVVQMGKRLLSMGISDRTGESQDQEGVLHRSMNDQFLGLRMIAVSDAT